MRFPRFTISIFSFIKNFWFIFFGKNLSFNVGLREGLKGKEKKSEERRVKQKRRSFSFTDPYGMREVYPAFACRKSFFLFSLKGLALFSLEIFSVRERERERA